MKATLEFNLDDPDDTRAHMRCVHATGMALVLWELVYNTRKDMEYLQESDESLSAYDMIDRYQEKIAGLLNEQGIGIDSLII